jgi:hypothetical protein
MNFNDFASLIVVYISLIGATAKLKLKGEAIEQNMLLDHTVVTDSNVFSYVVAILRKFSYLSAGALLDDQWVLTAADSLFL